MQKSTNGLDCVELRAELQALHEKLKSLEARQASVKPLPGVNASGFARGVVVGLLLLVSSAVFIGSLLNAQSSGRAFFIDEQGNITVATNLSAGGNIKARTLEGDGTALNLESNKSINEKLDKAGGTISGKLTIAGKSDNAGPALNVAGDIGGDNVWTKLHDVQLSSAADYTVQGLNGNAYRWFRIELQGTLTARASSWPHGELRKAIGIRPNGSNGQNDYGTQPDLINQWTTNTQWITFQNETNFLPLCIVYSRLGRLNQSGLSEGQLSCTGEMNTPTEMFRVMRSESSFVTAIPEEDHNLPPWHHRNRNPWEQENRNYLSSASAANFWRDEKTNITSLTLFFGGAEGFRGRFILYGKK